MYLFTLITSVSMGWLCWKYFPTDCDLETIEEFEQKELELKIKEENEIIEDFELISFSKKHD